MRREAFKEDEEGNLFTSSRQAAHERGFSTHVTQRADAGESSGHDELGVTF